jgi:outer membrane protein TolC
MPDSNRDPGSDGDRAAAAAALAALEAGVRQRRGELAALGGIGDELGVRLAELRQREFVQEPRPVSPRPGLGRLVVFVRKAFFHLFLKWHARAVLQQQNEFNQTAAGLLADLAESGRATRREVDRLRARVAELEGGRRGASGEAPAGTRGADAGAPGGGAAG